MFDFVKNGILVAVIAHGLIGISLVWDKVLLKRSGTRNLFSYVFWLGAISIFGLILIFFGYRNPQLWIIGLGFLAGLLDLIASFFYYLALKRGEASDTLAIMGGFAPIATAGIAYPILSKQMSGMELIGFFIMSTGGFCMFFSEKLPLKKLLPPVLVASGCFGLVNVLEKVVYNHTNFVSGFVWFTIGTFVGSVSMLIVPSWRQQIFPPKDISQARNEAVVQEIQEAEEAGQTGEDQPRDRFWYFVNRFLNGLGSFLTVYAISRANPAVVSAISGVRYAVIFLGALILTKFWPQYLKEDFRRSQLITKGIATGLVVAGVAIAGLAGSKGAAAAQLNPPHRLVMRAEDVALYQFRER